MTEPAHGHVHDTGRAYPIRAVEQPDPRGVVLDVIDDTPHDRDSAGGSIVIPRWIVLNGQGVLVPRDTKITVSAASDDVSVVTLTMMVRRARFGYADELGVDLPFLSQPEALSDRMETKDTHARADGK